MNEQEQLAAWFARLLADADDRADALDHAYQSLVNADLVNRVVLRRYQCRSRGCVVGTVVRIGGRVICRTRDYKFSPGINEARSVEAARAKNTLDGKGHWPGHTYDVSAVADLGSDAGMDMNCRHVMRTVLAADILAAVEGIEPGRPGAPVLL